MFLQSKYFEKVQNDDDKSVSNEAGYGAYTYTCLIIQPAGM